jgi:hypothetical protein
MMLSGLILVGNVPLETASASMAVTGVIGSDTTWSKANSPYVLTGNVLIANGVTLTIEPGASVNFNNYYIMVNGTLRAVGSGSDRITFNGGLVIFTNFSSAWSEEMGSGCIFENAVFNNSSITSSASIKVNGNSINGSITTVGSSIVTGNDVTDGVDVSGSCSVTNNVVAKNVFASGSCVVSNNTVSGAVTSQGSSMVTDNIVGGDVNISGGTTSHNIVSGRVVGGGNPAEISFNDVRGGIVVSIGSPTVANNTVKAGDIGINLSPNNYVHLNASILNNMVTAGNVGINIVPSAYAFLYIGWSTDAFISGNTIYNCSAAGIQVGGRGGVEAADNNATIRNNLISNCGDGIQNSGVGAIEGNTIGYGNYGISGGRIIRNNIVANNSVGINGGLTIEGNLVVNNQVGIRSGDQIRNNTIANNVLGIDGGFSTLVFNNIQNNINNIHYTSSADANATYNWWGTTDVAAINQTIYDYKNDFTLGRVNFVPLLTAPNPFAPSVDTPLPPIIPEVPTPMVMMVVMLVTMLIIVGLPKKKKR